MQKRKADRYAGRETATSREERAKVTNRTTILATYTEELAADLMARFISDLGTPCDVSISRGPGIGTYHVCVPADQFDETMRLLELTKVVDYDNPTAAEIVAGRFVAECIPCVLGGRATLDRVGIPVGYKNMLPIPYSVDVPQRLLAHAPRVLNEPPVSDEELAALALHTQPGPDDQI